MRAGKKGEIEVELANGQGGAERWSVRMALSRERVGGPMGKAGKTPEGSDGGSCGTHCARRCVARASIGRKK